MLGRFFKKEKPRVFLGALAVVPRTDLKRHFDECGYFESTNIDAALRQNLTKIFSLPPAQTASSPMATDLVLDVIIPKYQSGGIGSIDMGEIGFPIFWRPKVTVVSRLYSLTTNKTKATFSITEKMQWGQYLSRIFSWRGTFSFRPTFDREDIELLLFQACGKILVKMQKAIS